MILLNRLLGSFQMVSRREWLTTCISLVLSIFLIGLLSLHQAKQNLTQQVERNIFLWSEELALNSFGQGSSAIEEKIYQRLEAANAYSLVFNSLKNKYPEQNPLQKSSMGWSKWLHFEVPVMYYSVPAGRFVFKIQGPHLLKQAISSDIFILASTFTIMLFALGLLILVIIRLSRLELEQKKALMLQRQQITDQVIHDLKSPLSLLKILGTPSPDNPMDLSDYSKYLQKVERRIELLISNLGTNKHTSNDNHKFIPIRILDQTVQELAEQVGKQFNQQLHLSSQIEMGACTIPLTTSEFTRVLQNILVNACEANQVTGNKNILVDISANSSRTQIKIQDQGCGWSLSAHQKSSKGQGRGSGLTYVREQIQKSQGTIEYVNNPGSTGLTVTLSWMDQAQPLSLTAPAASYEFATWLRASTWSRHGQRVLSALRSR